ncbi:MAG: DUF429 domain-containing protein [Halobacteriaceae archaeon]
MDTFVGLDWAGRGWLGVAVRGESVDADLYPSLLSVWREHADAARILADVPIGLPSVEHGRRACDVEAKRRLGEAHRSVFYTPVREAVYQSTLADAKTVTERAGYSVQNQAWAVVPRIREADEFVDYFPGARDRLRETHPEVCFRALKGAPLDASKHTEAGREERRALLAAEHAALGDAVDDLVEAFTTPSWAPTVRGADDVLDACVAAATAARDPDRLTALTEQAPAETDARGLPMEIVAPADTEQAELADIG